MITIKRDLGTHIRFISNAMKILMKIIIWCTSNMKKTVKIVEKS